MAQKRLTNELGHDVLISATADEDSVLIEADGPHGGVWHRWTKLEAEALHDLLAKELWK